MQTFEQNVDINILIDRHVLKLTDSKYADDLNDCLELNKLDRNKQAEIIADLYFKTNDFNSIGGKKNYAEFINYIAHQIDRRIPLACFMKSNKSFSKRYNTLLTRRIFYSHEKDFFPITQNLVYRYEQNFDKEKEYIEKTRVTNKQLEFLKKLTEEQGFIIINQQYMSMETANKIISYLKGSLETEPRLFGFFVITV